MDVFLTVDVEIWPKNWDSSHERFPGYFNQFIRGRTSRGDFGLPFQLKVLAERGLKCIFFVEALFACEFGTGPLAEIIDLIRESGQEVQMHLHTEWVKHSRRPILPGRQGLNLRDFSLAEQEILLTTGLKNFSECGLNSICAFRAGNFGANLDTLRALNRVGINIDSSVNRAAKVEPFLQEPITDPKVIESVVEFPVTVYEDANGRLRHLQVAASSSSEMMSVLSQVHEQGRRTAVVFWHSAELLNTSRTLPDRFAIRRFEKLCDFLAQHRDRFSTVGFSDASYASSTDHAFPQPRVGWTDTVLRQGEQALRRLV